MNKVLEVVIESTAKYYANRIEKRSESATPLNIHVSAPSKNSHLKCDRAFLGTIALCLSIPVAMYCFCYDEYLVYFFGYSEITHCGENYWHSLAPWHFGSPF